MTIVPIKSTLHWDDVQQVWRLKASRQEKDAGGTKAWVPLVELAGTLAELLTAMLQFWAIVPTGTPATETVGAPIGDLGGAAALWAAMQKRPYEAPVAFAAHEGYADVDPGLVVYDGTASNWGKTP